MVLEDQVHSYDYNYGNAVFGSTSSLVERDNNNNNNGNKASRHDMDDAKLLSFKMPYQRSFKATDWSSLVESTMPLKTSALVRAGVNNNNNNNYGCIGSDNDNVRIGGHRLTSSAGARYGAPPSDDDDLFHASIERRSKEMSRKLIYVNLISLLINLLLAVLAFYFSFVNNSSSTTAFAADCVLDFISSAIVLWRYYGDLNDVYMHAREQIACIYLGALFEISALGIIIKASSDIASGVEAAEAAPGVSSLCRVTSWSSFSSSLCPVRTTMMTTMNRELRKSQFQSCRLSLCLGAPPPDIGCRNFSVAAHLSTATPPPIPASHTDYVEMDLGRSKPFRTKLIS
jgi:hypothetical protein